MNLHLKNVLLNLQKSITYHELYDNFDKVLIKIEQQLKDKYLIEIDKKTLIKKLIIQSSIIWPKFCILLMNRYEYEYKDYQIIMQAISNLFKNFCLEKNCQNLFFNLVSVFSSYFVLVQSLTHEQFNFSAQQWKELTFVAWKYYKNLPMVLQTPIYFMEIYGAIYQKYMLKFSLQERKVFINILCNILFIDLRKMSNLKLRFRSFIKFREKPYIIILDMILSNWYLLRPKYKKNLKEQIKRRVKLAKYSKAAEQFKDSYGINYINNLLRLAEVL